MDMIYEIRRRYLVQKQTVTDIARVAHFRLAYSRQMFVVAYPRETQEIVLDAHNRAFEFVGGVPARLIDDNLKTVVDTVYTSKVRQFNRRYLSPLKFTQKYCNSTCAA